MQQPHLARWILHLCHRFEIDPQLAAALLREHVLRTQAAVRDEDLSPWVSHLRAQARRSKRR